MTFNIMIRRQQWRLISNLTNSVGKGYNFVYIFALTVTIIPFNLRFPSACFLNGDRFGVKKKV